MIAGDDLETLRLRELAGGTWHVSSTAADRVAVSLCRCDGGEEVERLVSRDPAFMAYVASRPGSDADEPRQDAL